MKHTLYLLLVISSISTLYSQDFQAHNVLLFPGEYNSHEIFHSDQMGNQIIAGQGTGEIDFDFGTSSNTLPTTSYRDLYLAKYDGDNNLDWLLSFDGTIVSNQIRAIASDDQGNIYIGGSFSGTLNLTSDGLNEITSFGSSSMFVAKFDTEGNLAWQFTVGDTNFSQYPDKMFISNDRLIIQFVYTGTFDVDPGPGISELSGSSNAMLVYDLDGSFLDVNSHGGNTNVRASAMDSEGNLYLGGSFTGLVRFDYKSNASVLSGGISDAFLVKYDSDFNIIWLKTIKKTFKNLRFTQLAIDSDKDVVASGYFTTDINLGSLTASKDANYLINVSKEGDFEHLIDVLPESSFITDLLVNSKDQVILGSTFSEVVDIDPSDESQTLTPIEDNRNYLLAVYESDYSLVGSDQVYATSINSHGVYHTDTGQLFVLTDFEGEGKVVFGNQNNYTAAEEESFVFYELDIEGCTNTSESIFLEACNEVIINDETFTTSGEYQQFFENAEGCDSTLNISLNVYPIEQTSMMIESCDPIDIDGVTYSTSGSYTLSLVSIYGCDSTVIIDLEIIDIDINITLDYLELESNEEGAESFQWFDCESQLPIEDATNSTYAPEKSGSYQVKITKNSCVELSDCFDFVLSSTNDLGFEFNVYPNPTQGLIQIQNDENLQVNKVSILSLSGKELIQVLKLNTNTSIDLSDLPKGIYLLRIEHSNRDTYKKIVVY